MLKQKRFLLIYTLYNEYYNKTNYYRHVVVGHTKRYYKKALNRMGAKDISITEISAKEVNS